MTLFKMSQICLLLLLALNTEASFIIEVDLTQEKQNVRDYFEDFHNDRPIIGQFNTYLYMDMSSHVLYF